MPQQDDPTIPQDDPNAALLDPLPSFVMVGYMTTKTIRMAVTSASSLVKCDPAAVGCQVETMVDEAIVNSDKLLHCYGIARAAVNVAAGHIVVENVQLGAMRAPIHAFQAAVMRVKTSSVANRYESLYELMAAAERLEETHILAGKLSISLGYRLPTSAEFAVYGAFER